MGEVYLRLGDLQQCNGNWEQAVDDYTRSLKLYSTELEDDDRTLAMVRTSSTQRERSSRCICAVMSFYDLALRRFSALGGVLCANEQLHYQIATSYIYMTTDNAAQMFQLKQKALDHYIQVSTRAPQATPPF